MAVFWKPPGLAEESVEGRARARQGKSVREIARELGISTSHGTVVFAGAPRGLRVLDTIAIARTGRPVTSCHSRTMSVREIHLIMDNYGTHKTEKVRAWFAARPRYRVHFTPTSAFWLYLVERFFGQISEKVDQAQRPHQCGRSNNPSAPTSTRTMPIPSPSFGETEDTMLASVARAAAGLTWCCLCDTTLRCRISRSP